MIFDVMLRIEPDPYQRDPAAGWSATLGDPAWMLGRQWQMGEHQGEDASSPVAVSLTSRATAIDPAPGQGDLDPTTVPAQAVLESEPGDWWTTGRRVRAGRLVASAVSAAGPSLSDPALMLPGLPLPYNGISGLDGRVLWERRAELGLDEAMFAPFAPPATEPVDYWDPAWLSYTTQLSAGDATLVVERHEGGDLDWYDADASGPTGTAGTSTTVSRTPGRLRYPSAPLPRWWQIEDDAVSIGGQAPDRSSLATLVLIDLIVNHADTWYTVTAPAPAGHVVTVDQAIVSDSFGDTWTISPPDDWSLFATTGLPAESLVVWGTARTPLQGPVLDHVVLGMDEDANVVWAVEHVVNGTTLATPDPAPDSPPVSGPTAYAYLAMTPVPAHWHPYVVEDVAGRRSFVQGRAADLSGPEPVLAPVPLSNLLYDPRRGPGDPVHRIEPSAIPAEGLRLERRTLLARSTTGEPVLWRQRRRILQASPPALNLRSDLLNPSP